MGLQLTHHDVNWVYGLHHLKGKGYYPKIRQPEFRLIQCLPESSNGLNKDFLIVSWEWYDGLPYPTEEGQPGRVLKIGLGIVLCFITIYVAQLITRCFSWFCRQMLYSTKPLFG